MKLGAFAPRFLLESVEGGERLARYSFIGFGDGLEVRLDAGGLTVGTERRAPPANGAELLAGLRAALGIAWVVVVAAEMIAVDSGLGYLIIDSRNAGQRYDLVIAGMLLIGGIGILLDSGLARAGRIRSLSGGSGYDGIH